MKKIILGSIWMLLSACVPTEGAGGTAAPVISPSSTPKMTVTAVLTEQPVPPLEDDPTPAYPPPPIQPTPPYPGPPPGTFPTRIRSTPTPAIAVYPVDDCNVHPNFSRCGGAPLTGKLAYFSTNGQLTVLNLDAETAWFSTQVNLRDVDWSPAGDRLLVHDESLTNSYFYHQDGRLLHSETSGWVTWATVDNQIRAGTPLWNEDYTIAASLIFLETNDTGEVAVSRLLQVDFRDGADRMEWPLAVPDYRYDAVALLDWVPQTEWLLVGYANGGAATRIISGYRLMAVNARTGEIVDSGLFTPGVDQLDWHPSKTGLLVTTDLGKAEVGGLGALATWQVLENQAAYPSGTSQFARSPVWSPDGRHLAYSAYDLSGNHQLKILDTETNASVVRAEWGQFPIWSRDGTTIFYLEMEPGNESARIRAVGREQGEPMTIAESRFPRCPGSCLPRTAVDYTP